MDGHERDDVATRATYLVQKALEEKNFIHRDFDEKREWQTIEIVHDESTCWASDGQRGSWVEEGKHRNLGESRWENLSMYQVFYPRLAESKWMTRC